MLVFSMSLKNDYVIGVTDTLMLAGKKSTSFKYSFIVF